MADRHRVRGRRGDERVPAGQHRHLRDAVHVRDHHPELHLRRLDRRLPRAEDLLHDRRDVRLPLHVPQRAGGLRRQLRQGDLASRRDAARRRGYRDRHRRAGADLLALREEALGAGEAGRGHPQPAQALLHPCLPALVPLLDLQADRDRDLPRRVRDSGHVRVDHVGRRLGLAGQRDLVHARRGRDHTGDERARAQRVLQRPEPAGGRLLDRPAADHDRVEPGRRDRARLPGLRLGRREADRHPVVCGRQGKDRRNQGRSPAQATREEGEQRMARAEKRQNAGQHDE